MLLRGEDAVGALQEFGCALLTPVQVEHQLHSPARALDELGRFWERLPRDTYLRDGGRYRYRRHSCFVYETSSGRLEQAPHRAHWQPTDYNALHGGMERWFEPIEPEVVNNPVWQKFLAGLGAAFTRTRPVDRWYIEAHQFRIDTAEGIGRPTPEGAHRDGVDYVAVTLVQRHQVRGGETRVFEARGTAGVRFTMVEPWTTLLLDDARVIHETTPIQPEGAGGVRDTLVLTYRAGGFQSPPLAVGPASAGF
ncbi:MAG TPA: 2OG-Fe dioxygenase family protein [Povalibacter sp.]|uniref:2OG-Fe dioxygenase family protein n=1 Tax=Povalibacter sp. TaxID=1962978 RepID=UPI002BF32BBB|nr:2OG-Fe dioxygenase family protein [Povalibacter sp.]HMN44758.1 2OG-Fe dioxygenase family protein [Povalibacter sp.]